MTPRNAGRLAGALMLLQVPIAPLVNFRLLAPVNEGSSFLANGAAHAGDLRLAALLWFLYGAITIGIAAVAAPLFRRFSAPMAVWFVAVSVAAFAMLAVENITILSMLSLSRQYAEPGAAREQLEALAGVVASARIWAHYSNLLVGGGVGLVFWLAIWRGRLVPGALAIVGTLASLLLIGEIVSLFLGAPVQFALMAPIGLASLVLIGWLIINGFPEGTVNGER